MSENKRERSEVEELAEKEYPYEIKKAGSFTRTVENVKRKAFIKGYQKAQEEKQKYIDKLEFMIKNGLGEEDLKNDITYPSGD